MVFGENWLWLARCCPPRKGHHRLPQVVKNKLTGEGWSFFIFGRDAARETNALATREASLTMGGTCTFVNRRWLAHCWPSGKGHDVSPYKGHRRPTRKGTCTILELTTVQFVNGFRPSNKWPVCHRV